MTTVDQHPPSGRAEMSLLGRSFVLLLILGVCQLLLGSLAFSLAGRSGLWASLVAFLTSVVGGWMALLVVDFLGWLLRDEAAAFAPAVFGMLVRGGVSLSVCAIAYGFRFSVSQQGLAFYVLAFYMVTLAVETGFAVRQFSEMNFRARHTAKGQA